MSKRERLFEKFPPVSTEKWMEKITADLKGADFSRKMVWKTREGMTVMPFYRRDDLNDLDHVSFLPGEYPFVRGSRISDNVWLVRQDIEVTDYESANLKALDILMKGVTSLGFIITDPSTINVSNVGILLRDIHCESIEVNFVTAGGARELVTAFESVMWAREADMGSLRVTVAADPLGRLLEKGKLCVSVDEGLDYLAGLISDSSSMPGMRCICPSGILFSNAGAGPVAELAFTLSLGNEYMAAMTARGIDADTAAGRIRFTFGIGPEFFPEMAKLRAARMLWALIVKGYGPRKDESSLMNIHSVTGRWNKTLYDPYVNMLRTQTEAMSAVLGGADSVTVEPFDTVFRHADEFSERIARNQQLLLMEESHLGKVADPGAGSYYLEELTSMIAAEAWKIFIATENEGGFLEAARKGIIQGKINEAGASRKADIGRRRETLLGTNQYPSFTERAAEGIDAEKLKGSTLSGDDDEVVRIMASRGAEDFERLRISVEKSGRKPLAFMLTSGDLAMRRARAQFSSNFFACAGYAVKDNNGFAGAEDGVQAAMDAKADIIVICSSDEEYAKLAPEVNRLVGGRAIVVVAGNPPCTDDLKAEGIEHFISVKSNVLETLVMFSKLLGIN